MIFPRKNGRVTLLHSSSSTTIPSFGKILRREIPELLRTDTHTDGRMTFSGSSSAKAENCSGLKAQVSALVVHKPRHLNTLKHSHLHNLHILGYYYQGFVILTSQSMHYQGYLTTLSQENGLKPHFRLLLSHYYANYS